MRSTALSRRGSTRRFGPSSADSVVVGTAVSTVLALIFLAVAVGVETALQFGLVACIAAFSAWVAYRYPVFTTLTIVLLGQVLGHELLRFLPLWIQQPGIAGATLRLTDVAYLGLLPAILAHLHRRHARRRLLIAPPVLPLAALLLWFLLGLVTGPREASLVNSLGELRTYYQYLLLVPYLAVSLREQSDVWRLFRLLVGLSLSLMLLALLRGGLVHDFSLVGAMSGASRWFTAASGLGMVLGMVGLIVWMRNAPRPPRTKWLVATVPLFVFLIATNSHRSVWLAGGVAIAALFSLRQLPIRVTFIPTLVLVTAAVLLLIAFPNGMDTVISSASSRAVAFTNPADDPTASWRQYLWRQALDRAAERPLTGVGFGSHFQFVDRGGNLITTSPHNHYVTLFYHSGAVGLSLYLVFVTLSLSYFHRTLRKPGASFEIHVVTIVSLIALISSAAYFVSYSMDYHHLTWALISLGLCQPADGPCPHNHSRGDALRNDRLPQTEVDPKHR
jgi:O-antigen ligase